MTHAARQRNGTLLALIAITLLAFALRLTKLGDSPIRGDEAFTIQYWPRSFAAALDWVGIDPHPWGAYTLFANWRDTLGRGEWVMRLLPTLLSLPAVAAIYGLGRSLFNSARAGWLAGVLYATHPFLIWHAQDVRNYAVWASTSIIAAWALFAALNHNTRRHWIIYVSASLLSAYTFFLQAFILAAHALYVVLIRRKRFREWLTATGMLGLLLIPWLVELIVAATSDYGGTASRFAPQDVVTIFLPTLTIGSTLPSSVMAPLGFILLITLTGAAVALWGWRRHAAQLLLFSILIPIIIHGLVSLRMNVFRPRYIIAIAPYLLLLIAGVFARATSIKRRWGYVATTGIFALLIVDGWALLNLYANPAFAKAPDWRTLAAYLESHTESGDLVVQQALDPAFTYYFRGPADETTLPMAANAPAAETEAVLTEAITVHPSVWLVPSEITGYDDERVPLTWLTAETQRVANLSIAGFPVMEFRNWVVPPEEFSAQDRVAYPGIAVLHDWHIETLDTDIIRVLAYWEPISTPESPLHGFLHLVGPSRPDTGSPLWTQDDHAVTTDHWLPGQIRRDVYLLTLPEDQPQGDWQFHLGLYNPETLERVTTDTGADHVEIPLPAGVTELY